MKTNRQAYFLECDEYDIMIAIRDNIEGVGTYCPIRAVSGTGRKKPCIMKHDSIGHLIRDCENCVQQWLNEEYKG